jgi:hypothetical protein
MVIVKLRRLMQQPLQHDQIKQAQALIGTEHPSNSPRGIFSLS